MQPGSPTPLEITLKNTAVRSASRTIGGPVQGSNGTPGTVTLVESGIVDAADLGLGADRVPLGSSPLIDAGTTAADLGATDLLGNARTVGAAPDIGAYELQTPAPQPGPSPTPTPSGNQSTAPGGSTTADKIGPLLSFTDRSSTLKRSKLTKGKGLGIGALSSEAVAGGTLELLTRTTRKGKTTEKVLATAAVRATPSGPLTIALKGKASKLGKGKLKAILRLTLRDASGNATTVERKVTIS